MRRLVPLVLRPLVLSLCLLGAISMPAFAEDNNQAVDAISSRTIALEKELAKLQHEVAMLKRQQVAHKKVQSQPKAKQAVLTSQKKPAIQIVKLDHQDVPMIDGQYVPVDLDVPGTSFVTSGPYLGIPIAYSGSNLIINAPDINEDVALLSMRKKMRQGLQARGYSEASDHPHVLLSGIIETQVMYKDKGVGQNSSDVDVTSANLDAYILGSPWVSGLLSWAYDNDIGSNIASLSTTTRTSNSRVFVNKAFVTIGNFDKTPVYGSLGQMYVPFGVYANNMVSSPLTKVMARTKARAVLVGYQQQTPAAFYASTYAFKGDSHAGTASKINNGGINLGFRSTATPITFDIGGGVIANIADSIGMQDVGSETGFDGFGGASGTGNEQIVHRVPAYNLRGTVSLGEHVDLLAEYVGASTAFSSRDMTMNSHAAKPQAIDTEAAYTFTLYNDHPATIAVGYGKSKDALAIGLAAQRYSLVFNTAFWRNTLQSLEFRHDINYAQSDTSTGSSLPAASGPGKSDNVITAQFDMYF